jgi:Co/Zn/Cd efflux system component
MIAARSGGERLHRVFRRCRRGGLDFFAVRLGIRPADTEHPYGHRRAGNLAALGEAAILYAGGTFIVIEAIVRPTRVAPS